MTWLRPAFSAETISLKFQIGTSPADLFYEYVKSVMRPGSVEILRPY